PVGNRAGQLDKASFVRLSGSDTTLTLHENPDGARTALGPAAVQVCTVTASWTQGDAAMSFDQAPAYDTSACVAGTPNPDTSWTFDLSGFANRSGGNGFALVPTAGAPADFQVTFKTG